MNDLLHNMSAPPKSVVQFKQKQLANYMAFNPLRLAKLLGINYFNVKKICEKVEEYVTKHPQIEAIIEKPTGYMIAEFIEIDNKDKPIKDLYKKLSMYKYVECVNIELLIVIFCSTVGDLYIPNRNLSFESTKFDKILLFPEEEVNS